MITRYLHRNPQMIFLMIAAVLVAGASCLYVMPRLEDPVLKQRIGVIAVKQIGASASEIETSVVRPIEAWLGEFSDIKSVRSISRANVANVVVELANHVQNTPTVWAAIENKLRSRRNELPKVCSEPDLTVIPLKAYAAILALVPADFRGDESRNNESLKNEFPKDEYRIAKELEKRLLRIEGTESVDIFGGAEEELRVEFTPATLAATGLSTGMVAQQISDNRAISAGNFQQNGQSLGVGLQQEPHLRERIENVPIAIPGTADSSRLGELANVSYQTRQPRSEMAIIDGKPAIVVAARVDNEYRVDLWNQRCLQTLTQLTEDFPGDYEAKPIFLQADQIKTRIDQLLSNFALGTAAVVFIVFLFLGWRCMIVVAITLPLSACLVLCGLRLLNIPIHQMSVTGLIVSLGLLIDNAIVMVEEVRARIYQGKTTPEAIVDATSHLGLPLLGSTITTILTFLPIAIMTGPSGEFVGTLAVSVILAISASLLLSFTVVPPLVGLLGVNPNRNGFLEFGLHSGTVGGLYKNSLEFVFRRPLLGIILGAVLPIAGFLISPQLQKQFFPATDRAQIQIELDMPASSNLDAVRRCVEDSQAIVDKDQAVDSQYWFLGKSAPTFYYNVVPRRRSTPNYAQAFVDLTTNQSIDTVVNRLQASLDAKILDARVIVRKLEQGPPFDAPIEIRVLGDNLQLLEEAGKKIRSLIAAHPRVTHTRADLGDRAVRLDFEADEQAIAEMGLTDRDLSQQLYLNLEGADAGEFSRGGEQVPVRVAISFTGRSVLDSLLSMPIAVRPKQSPQSASGNAGSGSGPNVSPNAGAASTPPERASPPPVALGGIGNFSLQSDPGTIIRLDGQRVNEVKAYLQAGVLPADVLADLEAMIKTSDLQFGGSARIEIGGEAEKRSAAISTLAANLTLIISLMIITLVAVLGSFRAAFIIASIAGLVIGLGPLSLYCFGYPFGFMAIVGTMGLVGIAINDSIVVLAGIQEDMRFKQTDENESTSARPATEAPTAEALSTIVFKRTRHILATTVTTMIGFLPLVLAGGKFWPPLAIVISAGVAGATLMALYFTPSLYLLLHSRKDGDHSRLFD